MNREITPHQSLFQICVNKDGPYDPKNSQYDKYFRMYNQMEEELTKKKMMKIMEMEYQLNSLSQFHTILYNKEKDLKTKLQVKMSKDHNNGYAWITINPNPSIKLETFIKVIEKIVKKTCFTDYIYVYEQRGTDTKTLGKGFHAHLLLKRNLKYKPTKCKFNVKDTLKRANIVTNWQHGFDYKTIGDEFAVDKLDYILGLKTGTKADGTAKAISQKYDAIWRLENKLEPYYGTLKIS